jgi:protein-tyrosine-phosphatase
MSSVRIIFVCSGNICRSPLAAGIAKARLEEAGISAVIISAGTLQIVGKPAAANSVAAGEQVGIDISGHRSQGLTRPLIDRADYLVVMSPEHEDYIVRDSRAAASKVVRLWEWVGLDRIDDPIGRPLHAFTACRDTMTEAIEAWIKSEWGS